MARNGPNGPSFRPPRTLFSNAKNHLFEYGTDLESSLAARPHRGGALRHGDAGEAIAKLTGDLTLELLQTVGGAFHQQAGDADAAFGVVVDEPRSLSLHPSSFLGCRRPGRLPRRGPTFWSDGKHDVSPAPPLPAKTSA
jgi:hypothetical protein